jgi:hypothetical protein
MVNVFSTVALSNLPKSSIYHVFTLFCSAKHICSSLGFLINTSHVLVAITQTNKLLFVLLSLRNSSCFITMTGSYCDHNHFVMPLHHRQRTNMLIYEFTLLYFRFFGTPFLCSLSVPTQSVPIAFKVLAKAGEL